MLQPLLFHGVIGTVVNNIPTIGHGLGWHRATDIEIVGMQRRFLFLMHDTCNDNRYRFSTYLCHRLRCATRGMRPVKSLVDFTRNQPMPFTLREMGHQLLGNRNLRFRFFCERYANCIANTVGQQGSYAHSTLDTSVFTLTCFCYAQMQRIAHGFLQHAFYQQSHSLHHDHRIR